MAVVVTGAAGDLGRAIVARLVGEGRRVLVLDADARGAEQVARAAGALAQPFAADVTREDDVAAALEHATVAWGTLDGLVLNAGVEGPVGPLTSVVAEDFDRVVAVNVRGVSLAPAIPLARYARPDEIAATICWLLSDEASYVTGAAIAVDGGLTTS